MSSDPRSFYDDLAEDYDLIYADWDAAVRRQGPLIDGWLGGGEPLRVLDAACGMGTQAIALALCGHRVVARDLSPRLVERARREADRFGVEIDLGVADLRELEFASQFDAVLALDNALPHLESDADLVRGLRSVHRALRPGGRLLASIRDYDRLVEERPLLDPPRALGESRDRRIVLQAWDWDADAAGYWLDLLMLRRQVDGAWTLNQHRTRYRALLRADLEHAATTADLVDTTWMEPEVSGFYQPVFSARRPG